MDINKAFPSQYLKAADLDGKTPTVVIDRVEMEDVGDDRKMVLYFVGKDKGLVLNKTNANSIADILGSTDTDDWHGKKIKLFTAKVEYQGKRVPAIRIDEPGGETRKPEPVHDEEVPF